MLEEVTGADVKNVEYLKPLVFQIQLAEAVQELLVFELQVLKGDEPGCVVVSDCQLVNILVLHLDQVRMFDQLAALISPEDGEVLLRAEERGPKL